MIQELFLNIHAFDYVTSLCNKYVKTVYMWNKGETKLPLDWGLQKRSKTRLRISVSNRDQNRDFYETLPVEIFSKQ
jgi:hypothetical protein